MNKILSLFLSLVLWLGISGFGVAYGVGVSMCSPTNGLQSNEQISRVSITFQAFKGIFTTYQPAYNSGTAVWKGPDGTVLKSFSSASSFTLNGNNAVFEIPTTEALGTYTLTIPANFLKGGTKYSDAFTYTYTLIETPAVLEMTSATPATYFNASMQEMSLTFAQPISIADAAKITVTAGGKACAGTASVEGNNTLKFKCDASLTSGLVTLNIGKSALKVNGKDVNIEFFKSWFVGERVTNAIGHITEYYGSSMASSDVVQDGNQTTNTDDQGMNKKEVVYYNYLNKSLGRCTYAKTTGKDEWKAADYHRYEYDANGHIVADDDYKWGVLADGSEGFTYSGSTKSVFSADGLRTQRTDAQNNVVNYEYDSDKHLIKETHVDAKGATTQTITYSDFDAHGTAQTVASDGPLYAVQYVLKRTTDANGKIIKERKLNKAQTSVSRETRRFYDATGFLEKEEVFKVEKNASTGAYDVLTYLSININEPVAGNAYRIKSWSKTYSDINDAWSTSQTYTITESMAPEGEKYHAMLTTSPAEGINCVDLKVSLPDAIANASYGLNIYRKGVLIAGPIAYTANFTYTDKNNVNGDYDYFVEIASLDANGKQVSTYNVSDFVIVTFNAPLPLPGVPYWTSYTEEMKEYKVEGEDEDGNKTDEGTETQLDQTIGLKWDAPEGVSQYGFQGYNLYRQTAKGLSLKQNEELITGETYSYTCTEEESITLQLEAVYTYGKVKTDAVTFKPVVPSANAAYNGMTTFYNGESAYQLAEGMNAYWAKIDEDGEDGPCLLLTAMDERIIPADNACVITGTGGKPFLLTQTETETYYDENILSGSPDAFEQYDDEYVYVLSVANGNVGFYRYRGTVAANKAYILSDVLYDYLNDEEGAPTLRIVWDSYQGEDANMGNASAIESVEVNRQVRPEVYDMLGRKVTVAGRGLYIVNGKKALLK